MPKLTHMDEAGDAHMVDVGAKPMTRRVAVAEGEISLSDVALRAVVERSACGGARASRAAHFAGASSPRKKFFRLSMSPIAGAPALRTACEAAAGLLCSRWAEAATGTAWKPCAAPASASTRQVRRIAMSRSRESSGAIALIQGGKRRDTCDVR